MRNRDVTRVLGRPVPRIALSLVLAAGIAACGHDGSTSPSDATPLVLENLGVDIAAYDPGTSLAGGVFLQPWVPKAFGEFGQPVLDQNGNRKPLPTFDFVIPDNVAIVSAIAGVVTKIFNQGGDYEILIAPNRNSAWFVSLDHVSKLQVAEGQSVSVGQAVAYGAPYPDNFVWAGKHLAFFEFMIVNHQSSQASCPIDYLDASLKDAYRAKITRLMQDVEPFIKTDIGHYDVGAMVEPGCLAHTVSAS